MAYGLKLKNSSQGRDLRIYTYLGSTPSISDTWATSISLGCALGIPGGCGPGWGDGCPRRCGRCAPVPFRLQSVWGFRPVPSSQGRQPSVRFCQSIAGCLSMAAFTFLFPGNSTPCFCYSGTSAVVSWLVIAFAVLRRAKCLLWPCWPYSWYRACETVLSVPNLVALP